MEETITLEGNEPEGSFKIKIKFKDENAKNELLKLIQLAIVRERDRLLLPKRKTD